MTNRDQLVEQLIALKGKTELGREDWELVSALRADPDLINDLEIIWLLNTLEDERRLNESSDKAFLRLKAKIDAEKQKNKQPANEKQPWWAVILKPRRAWGLPLVLAQVALLAVYLNVDEGLQPDQQLQIYRSAQEFDACRMVTVQFKPEASIEEITDLLQKAGMKIVDGPGERGRYVVGLGFNKITEARVFLSGIAVVDPSTCSNIQ